MTEPTEKKKNPSRALRATAAVAGVFFWSLWAACVCLAAVWAALHGFIVPRIADFRPRLEAEATRLLGAPVRIGSLTARSNGLIPTFALADVTVRDAQGRTALRLPLVVAALSPRSLLHLGLEQLYIDAPEIDMRRTADGRLFVAGQWIKPAQGQGSRGADWLFSQAEVIVRGATVHWNDERTTTPPLSLTQVDLTLRNSPWHHALRLDATPPAERGARFSVLGQFSQSLLSIRPGNWRDWSGTLYAELPRVDLTQLHAQLGDIVRQPAPLPAGAPPPGPLFGLERAAGHGVLRAWADVAHGGIEGATLDVAMADLDLRFAAAPEGLALQSLSGRIAGHRDSDGFDIATSGLALSRADGYVWPGGNVSLRHSRAGPGRPARTDLGADKLDLAALAGLARGLPLDDAAQRALVERAPRGVLQSLDAHWDEQGLAGRYQVRGRVTGLAVGSLQPDPALLAAAAAVEAAMHAQDPRSRRHVRPPLGRPGVRGADVDFEFSEAGGKANIAMAGGALDYPGLFEEPVVPLDTLQVALGWQRGADGRLSVEVPHASFANADLAGELRASWRTGDEAEPLQRVPGVLDLSGSLSRADGTRVHRYLPRSISPEVRAYVNEAISAGTATAEFRVRGDLRHMPFDDPKLGQFRIDAKVRDVTYAYAPPEIEHAGALPWPALVKLGGELIFEGRGMEIRNATGQLESPDSMLATGARGVDAPAPRTAATPPLRGGEVQVLRVDAQIPDMSHAVIAVQARTRGPLAEMLGIVDAAPLAGLTNHALSHATANGTAELQLGLSLPLAELRRASVRGNLQLADNDMRITPQSPLLGRTRGTIAFTEGGFSLIGTQARMLGGEIRVEGGLKTVAGPAGAAPPTGPAAHVLALKVQGTLTAEGLRQAPELGATARLAGSASGGTAYTAAFNASGGHLEVSIDSSLQGLALDFPAPIGKSADSSLPLHFETRLLAPQGDGTGQRDELRMSLGDVVAARFLRSLEGGATKVLAGSLAVGLEAGEQAPLPDDGVAANVRLTDLDVDAWRAVLGKVGQQAVAPAPALSGPGTAAVATPATSTAMQRSEGADYLPDTLALRADRLTAANRTLHKVVIGGSHKDGLWRANVDAQELGGYLEYRQAGGAAPPRFYARLARLQVPETAAQDVESLTDSSLADSAPAEKAAPVAAPNRLPALDIVVDDFLFKDRRLGKLEVQAVNQDAEWRLDKLQITLPEATFAATGRWGRRAPGAARRTNLDFHLDLRDSGALLGRLGMPGVVAHGAGQLKGRVDWLGSPFVPDYGSMDGQLRLDVSSGQFLKADPGLAKLLGVLSLQSLPRRFALDFRDVFAEGFAFDSVRGDVGIDDGIAHTDNLEMKGVAAAVSMDGSADIRRETQNLRVVVVPEINAGTASLVATIVNPVVGLSTFVAQAVLRGPLIKAATQEFDITGRWDAPKIVKLTGSERGETR